MRYEAAHMNAKLLKRCEPPVVPDLPDPHPQFRITSGPIADWERPHDPTGREVAPRPG